MKQSEIDYLKGGSAESPDSSSLLRSSSKYLNSARLRDVLAQEALRRNGRGLPLAYLVPDAIQAFDELKDVEQIERLLDDEKRRKPELAAWLDERYLSNFAALDLGSHAPGTLGAVLREFITGSGYAIDFMFLDAAKSDYGYLQKRLAQNHDIEHMVTGFGTDPCGEHALMTCNATSWLRYFDSEFAGEMCRFNVYLTMVGTLRAAMHYPRALPAFLEALRFGNEAGSSLARPLFLMRWEDYLDRPIVDIRRELNIPDAPEGCWAWTEDAWRDP